MNNWQLFLKRSFDILFALIGLMLFGWLILICWMIAFIDTGITGFYTQQRIGKNGNTFRIIKIRTMKHIDGMTSVVTVRNDPRITRIGSVFRKLKLDELPQLINVLSGKMSFVGPRPDVAGFADLLQGDDRIILSVRPGITGPATLIYSNEEDMLAHSQNPEQYNREVIFQNKTKINRQYIQEYTFYKDILYIVATIIPGLRSRVLKRNGVVAR